MKNWSLTSKLVASVLALFLAVTVAIGGATVLLMNRMLEGQVIDQLSEQTQKLESHEHDDHGIQVTNLNCATPQGQLPPDAGGGVLRACTDSPWPPSGYTLTHGEPTPLTAGAMRTLQAAGLSDRPTRVDLGAPLGQYLVTAKRLSGVEQNTRRHVSLTVYTGMPMTKPNAVVHELLRVITLASLAGLVLTGLLGTWLVRSNLVPLKRVAGTAQRVSQLELSRGDVSLAERVPAQDTNTRTEVGQVGNALNQMLDHVDEALTARQQSEQRVRQFVADASHELRTPLASIRGYAEISRKEREPVPSGVRHALDRIESEAKRMTGLVEDMLLLARLDAGRPLDRAPVDLTMMLIETVGDIQAAAPDHVWKLHLPDEAVEVPGDAGRLKQVAVNLLGNARAHTPAGTTVTAGLEVDADVVRLIVHDDGPGIPESLQPNLFQRFTRADEARNRAAGSTGLGLSIVDAVVKAHHGRIDVSSHPGATTFTVTLPR